MRLLKNAQRATKSHISRANKKLVFIVNFFFFFRVHALPARNRSLDYFALVSISSLNRIRTIFLNVSAFESKERDIIFESKNTKLISKLYFLCRPYGTFLTFIRYASLPTFLPYGTWVF